MSDVLLSLQDICKIYIVARLDEFPIDALALLPPKIRQKLLLLFPRADVLHFLGDHATFSDDDIGLVDLLSTIQTESRRELTEIVLHGVYGNRTTLGCSALCKSATLRLFARQALDCCSTGGLSVGTVVEHISKWSCLQLRVIPGLEWPTLALPARFFQYFPKDSSFDDLSPEIQLSATHCLLDYCNLQTAPKQVMIDCSRVSRMVFWKEYQRQLEEKKSQLTNRGLSSPAKNDPIIPFMQEFLSSVETLELGVSHVHAFEACRMEDTMGETSYIILYNIITGKHPHLKHLKVSGLPILLDWLLSSIFQLLCNTTTRSPFFDLTETEPASPLPRPYLLESLSVLPKENGMGYPEDYMTEYLSSSISSATKAIIDYQLHNLKTVTVHGLGFCYGSLSASPETRLDHDQFGKRNVNTREYKNLLSSLVDLLKQPQLTSLSIIESPLPEGYELIKTFLFTPTSHEQSLEITAIDYEEFDKEYEEYHKDSDDEEESESDNEDEEENESDEDEIPRKRPKKCESQAQAKMQLPKSVSLPNWPLPNHPLPETNSQFKCLDLGMSSSCVHTWLFSLQEIKLKRLNLRTQDITLVPVGLKIQVEHVSFSTKTFTSYRPTISPEHLEIFTISNPALKTLEFSNPVNECVPGLLSALTQCLDKLNKEQRSLEQLRLNQVDFEHGDPRDFFKAVRNLSQNCGTTLYLSPEYYSIFSQWQEIALFPALGEDFKEKKIRKIVCTMKEDYRPMPYLALIADEIVIYL